MPNANHTPVRDYFYAHLYDVTDECMIWPYATTAGGYGQVWLDGRYQGVHVLACIARHGPRPEGMEAAHGPCHNRLCWNGKHLSWKTRAQNAADMVRDGTVRCGAAASATKLTAEDVLAIRAADTAGGVSQRRLAAKYGVGQDEVSRIVNRKRWAHI